VVFVNEASLKHLSGGSTGNAEKLCQDPKIKAAALKELNATGKKAGFRSLEVGRGVVSRKLMMTLASADAAGGDPDAGRVDAAEWAADCGPEASGADRLGRAEASKPGSQRKQIFEHYKDQIKACCMFVSDYSSSLTPCRNRSLIGGRNRFYAL
jgi:hypothetical protein